MRDLLTFILCIIILILLTTYFLFIFYIKLTTGKCKGEEQLTGKTVLITGSDKGIGYETALDLAKRQARVIMACRDIDNALKMADYIKLITGNTGVIAKKLDVSSLTCVKKFAEDFLREEKDLHVIILNAGIPSTNAQLTRTQEGFETVFATNYLGHFFLTILLLDLLKKSQPSRIISISSLYHRLSQYPDASDLNSEKSFQPAQRYARSKLLQILFTKELSRKLQDTNVTVNCLNPGPVNTNIFKKLQEPWRTLTRIISHLSFKSPEDGAQTTIYLATSKEVEGMSGLYFSDCKLDKPSDFAEDVDLAKKVFEASKRYCNPFYK